MLEIKVINCDGMRVPYDWNSLDEFVKDMNSDNEAIPMMDDVLSEVDTDDAILAAWWRNEGGIAVNDLYEQVMQMLNPKKGKCIKLYDYLSLCEDGMEVTVWDKDWDMETHFYTPLNEEDDFEKAMKLIARCVDICEIKKKGVEVNFFDVIKKSKDALIKAGFYNDTQDEDDMMDDVDVILAGNLSEENTLKWAETICNALNEQSQKAIMQKVRESQRNGLKAPGITREQLKAGYEQGIVRLGDSPNDDGVICWIGQYWFYFGGRKAEDSTVGEYQKNVPEEDIISEIYDTLCDFVTESPDEYAYYAAVLEENGL